MQQTYVYVFGFRWSEWKRIRIFRLNFCVVSVFPLIESFDIFLFSSVQRMKKPGGLRKMISAQLWGEKKNMWNAPWHIPFNIISWSCHSCQWNIPSFSMRVKICIFNFSSQIWRTLQMSKRSSRIQALQTLQGFHGAFSPIILSIHFRSIDVIQVASPAGVENGDKFEKQN